MDLKLASFEGKVVQCSTKFQSGDSVVLSLVVRISSHAFEEMVNPSGETVVFGQEENVKESGWDKLLRQRRESLVMLLSTVNLRPISTSAPTSASSVEEKLIKKDKKAKKNKTIELDSDGEEIITVDFEAGVGEEAEGLGLDGEGEVIDAGLLDQVYSKAIKNDQNLPQRDPPSTFKVSDY